MNNLGRILLLVAGLVLALVVGVLIGRDQRVQPTSESAAGMQITTTPAIAPPPPPPPLLPAPVQTPKPAPIPKVAPDMQVQEDAAAVGMTTREPAEQPTTDAGATSAAPKSAASRTDESQPQPPNG